MNPNISVRIASIDIGLKNLAISIEDVDRVDLTRIENIPNFKRYNKNGELTPEFQKILNQVYLSGNIIFIEKVNLLKEGVTKKHVDDEVLISLSRYLDTVVILDTCDFFVIEKQLQGRVLRNNIAKRLEDHIYSYLIEKYRGGKEIISFPSSNKTKVLGAPKYPSNENSRKKMSKYQRKRWAEKTAEEILLLREDYFTYDLLFKSGEKLDDYADTICQLQAFKYKKFVNQVFKMKWTLETVAEIVASFGGKVLSKEFINSRQPLEVKCEKEHVFTTVITSLCKGSFCGYCSPESKEYTIDQINNIVKEKYEGKSLSEKYINSKTKMEFQCKQGHIFLKTMDEIISLGDWCTRCSHKNSGKEICRIHFEYLFAKPFPAVKPLWLKNSKGNLMELDGYNDELKMAFEYSGKEHYQFMQQYHKSMDQLEERIENEKLKYELCRQQNITVIEVPHSIPFKKLKEYLLNQIPKSFSVVTNVIIPYENTKSFNQANKYLQEIRELVSENGGRCLSEYYINARIPLIFKCEHGVVFEQTSEITKKKIQDVLCWCKCQVNKRKTTLNDKSCEYVLVKGKKKGEMCGVRCSDISSFFCSKHRGKTIIK